MDFFKQLIDIVKPVADKVITASNNGFPFSVSEARLNTLAAEAIVDEPNLTRLNLTCLPDELVTGGEVRLAKLPVTFKIRLALESCEITPARKLLILRRLGDMELDGPTLPISLFARLIKILVCGLFGIDPTRFALKGISGLTMKDDYITADLDVMGAQDALANAVRTRLSEHFPAQLIDPILDAAGDALFARVEISEVEIRNGEICGHLKLVGEHHES